MVVRHFDHTGLCQLQNWMTMVMMMMMMMMDNDDEKC